ncbi:outer membrane beta-barrel protein [Devosia rhodophyticola]|uniref:Outer membrane beta-barrel protein n=1 Tax=Devosia rhodophyticola TaxID=3026423 RepID=A0ABY7YUW7_9HYPH|nr:DUF5777 family beta-barrel protein [Devosia rhodophyticola]WDR04840.1 outer membrane beta-barrel protein [Devosia rhodophyticola]
MSRRLIFSGRAVLLPASILVLAGAGTAWADPVAAEARLPANQYPLAPDPLPKRAQLREPFTPFFVTDWTLSLRGTYRRDGNGERYEAILAPEVSLKHQGNRANLNIDASGEVRQPIKDQISVSGLRLGIDGDYQLDQDTSLTGALGLTIDQPEAGDPGQPSSVASAPTSISGSGSLGVSRQLSRFNVGITGAINRTIYGQSTLTTGAVVDNGDQNIWGVDGELRVGYRVTPIIEVFAQAGVGRDMFDHASPTLLVKTDATSVSLEAGIKGQWGSVLEAEATAGVGLRRFDEASLGEVRSTLYDASVSYLPNSTLRLTGGFTTTVEPPGPDSSGTTRTEYAARGTIDYTINSWLAVNGLANWRTASFSGTANTERGFGLGAGAQYKVNRQTSVTADYAYDHSESTADGTEDSHTVSVGVTLKR